MSDPGTEVVTAVAPGRVNLIGDHTDYMGGLVLPMAVDLATTVSGVRGGNTIDLVSAQSDLPLRLDLPVTDPSVVQPPWGRYVAGVAAELGSAHGFRGTVDSTVPVGGGLSSSAALEVAVALALGATGTPLEIAQACQRAEVAATGVPCGIMDQLCSAAGVEGHALLIDCATMDITPVPVPDTACVWVVDSGQQRELAGSAYAERRSQCEAAAALVGPLPTAEPGRIDSLQDPLLRARARHVRSECDRVRSFAAAFVSGDLAGAGRIMVQSHASLRDDFGVSTPVLDDLVDRLVGTDGVYGARLTGAGFGGCVVALARPGVHLDGWAVQAAAGARLEADPS